MNKKIRFLLLMTLPILLLAFLAYKGLENSAAYYYTLAEVSAMESSNQKLRLKGKVDQGSVEYIPEVPLLSFALIDGEHRLDVIYEGVLPDNFSHAQEVIVEGQLNQNREFVVSKLMLQCPSKYEEGE